MADETLLLVGVRTSPCPLDACCFYVQTMSSRFYVRTKAVRSAMLWVFSIRGDCILRCGQNVLIIRRLLIVQRIVLVKFEVFRISPIHGIPLPLAAFGVVL